MCDKRKAVDESVDKSELDPLQKAMEKRSTRKDIRRAVEHEEKEAPKPVEES